MASRKIKPISFNEDKDADLLQRINEIEKTRNISYAQYIKELIRKDINQENNNSQYIINEITNNIKELLNNKNL